MNKPLASVFQRWLPLARLLLLAWILITVVSTILSLPARFQSLRNLEPVTASQSAFYGWSSEQIRAVIQELGIPPEWVAVIQLSTGLVCLLCFWVVGGLIFWRRSKYWDGLLPAFILFSTGPGFSGLFLSQSQAFHWAKVFDTVFASIVWPTFFLMLYLFPNGRFEPRFTRHLVLIPYITFLAAAFLFATNLVGTAILQIVILIYAIGGLASQVYRYRKVSTPEERQQTKWVVFALGTVIALAFTTPFLLQLFPAWKIGTPSRFWFELIGYGTVGILLTALLPLALGVSILRYRLWDIDIIIRRTLSYAILTALLGLGYFGIVTALQALVSGIGGRKSAAITVVSTLAIAALFNPLRRRVQDFIDRRFYRQKYDAERALERFSSAARHETELGKLSSDLTDTIRETLQPGHVKLWLKEGSEISKRDGHAR